MDEIQNNHEKQPWQPDIGIVGATGAVGEVLIELLQERAFPYRELRLLASERSAGQMMQVAGCPIEVQAAEPDAFEGLDFVFFAATGDLSKTLAPEAVKRGAIVIDKSNTFRMQPGVPLVVPEINPQALGDHAGIIACPNCTTIGLTMALAPIARLSPPKRLIVTTLQAVSGAGRDGLIELQNQLRDPSLTPSVFAAPIAGNVVPQCDNALASGESAEERKLAEETRKILELPDLAVNVTCVRVPVEVGHSASVVVESHEPISPEAARSALDAFPGVTLVDDWQHGGFPTPLDVRGRDDVLVGRVRREPGGRDLCFWEVSDNLRKGAATNAIQIAETLLAGRGPKGG